MAVGIPWETVLQDLDGKDPNTPSNRLKGRCFDAVTVLALLGESGVGLGIQETEPAIEFVEDIQGSEVEWTRGAAISSLQGPALNMIMTNGHGDRKHSKLPVRQYHLSSAPGATR